MVCKLNLNTFDLNAEKTGKSEGMGIGPGVVYANPALLLHIQEGNLSRTQAGKWAGNEAKSNTHTLSAIKGQVWRLLLLKGEPLGKKPHRATEVPLKICINKGNGTSCYKYVWKKFPTGIKRRCEKTSAYCTGDVESGLPKQAQGTTVGRMSCPAPGGMRHTSELVWVGLPRALVTI